nr:MAG TPA: hypothetical protein [Caudoviricetes sp.]
MISTLVPDQAKRLVYQKRYDKPFLLLLIGQRAGNLKGKTENI